MAKDLSGYYESTTHEQIIEEDRRAFRAIVDNIAAADRLSDTQKDEVVSRFVGLMNQIYRLTIDGLEGNLKSAEQQARFNRIFKLI
jgi:hypothetical protein